MTSSQGACYFSGNQSGSAIHLTGMCRCFVKIILAWAWKVFFLFSSRQDPESPDLAVPEFRLKQLRGSGSVHIPQCLNTTHLHKSILIDRLITLNWRKKMLLTRSDASRLFQNRSTHEKQISFSDDQVSLNTPDTINITKLITVLKMLG